MIETLRAVLDTVVPALHQLPETSPLSLLGAATTLLGLALLLRYLACRSAAQRHADLTHTANLLAEKDRQLAAVSQQLAQQDDSIEVLTERLASLEGYLEMLGSKQQRLEADQRDPVFYEHLLRLAEKGMSAAELCRRFGISASEAALITAMHRKAG